MEERIELSIGASYSSRVENMAGGGYLWILSSENETVTETSVDPDPPGTDRGVGGAQTQTILIKARSVGISRVRLELKRPWDEGPPLKSLQFSVRVTQTNQDN